MQDAVFLATYIGFMLTLTWMAVAIHNNLREQPRQTFYVTANDFTVEPNTVEEEEEEVEDEPNEEENVSDD